MNRFVSLCMIVKDEESVLKRCLSSVVHLVDEIVIVDTGSKDQTKEVALEFTSNLFEFKWVDDFSAARNYAASKATGEWILVLDADEYIDENNLKAFLKEVRDDNGKYDTYSAKIINFTGNSGEKLIQNFHARFYKNNGLIKYNRKIHEQLTHCNGDSIKIKNSSLLIFHSGYLDRTVNEKDKHKRNNKLLTEEMGEGNNLAFEKFNFGNESYSMGDYDTALENYVTAYKLNSNPQISWVSVTLVQIIICLINLKRYNDALNVIRDAESIYPNSPDLPYLKGEIFFQKGQVDDSRNTFLQIVNNLEHYNHVLVRPDFKDQIPHTRLGEIYFYEENFQNAIYHYTSVLNVNKYNADAIGRVIYILNKFHSPDEINSFLKTKELISNKNIEEYIKVSFYLGNPDLALSLLENKINDNQLLYRVGLIKKICIYSEANIQEINKINEILDYQVFRKLISQNLLNYIDIFLLEQVLLDNLKITEIVNSFNEDPNFRGLLEMLDEESIDKKIDANLYVFALQTFLNYSKTSFVSKLLNKLECIEDNGIPKVAALLFSNGYKIEAIKLYEKVDWGLLDVQDFLNIISVVQTNRIADSVDIASYAISVFDQDFRLYKIILENTPDANLFSNTLKRAREIFSDSEYLNNLP
ncbi:TPR domain-containing glycosyltransferase [Bacillus pinisoli]|uniref:tetratricopeptide repeat-containing glycosyltransferase family 2 protein n=1 Tax=Bacillus pinisoli TaxID=2901866 RepID=UPI001FF327B3|nr:TPR domain-containing glycosyltransferase [Bacillus pinisoli]